MNKELLQAAKDQAAQYYGFKNYDEMVEDTTPDDKFINRAMEIYAERVIKSKKKKSKINPYEPTGFKAINSKTTKP